MEFILSIDQGTTGSRASLINAKTFEYIGEEAREFPQIYPSPGLVEHNLNDIWNSIIVTIEGVLKKYQVNPSQIKSIGITNQRETTCAFDKKGLPLHHAIVWQDRRTSHFCDELKKSGHENTIKEKTGLTVDPYFSSTKMNWLLKNSDSVKEAAKSNNLLFGTIDTFILFKMTNGHSHKTDSSNASRTMLMNLRTLNWDQEMLDLFEIKKEFLPEICDSFHEFGVTKNLGILPDGIPITGILGDQQAALFGQAGFNKGDFKCTYGTGAFLLFNTGNDLHFSKNGLLTTVAFSQNKKPVYALEGSTYIAGAAVQWLRDNLKIIQKASDIEALANRVQNLDEMKNIVVMPFFTGIGSPHWKPEALAAIVGITRDTNNSHIARATLEGIALSINDLIEAIRLDTNLAINSIRVDGGAVKNNLLCEIQASSSDLKVIRPKVIETTAYGAALASAVGAKMMSIDEITHLWKMDKEFHANNDWKNYYLNKKQQWKSYIHKLFL